MFRKFSRVAWSLVLSLVVPGLGLIYARAWRRGFIVWTIGATISCLQLLIPHALPPSALTITIVFGLSVLYLPISLGTSVWAALLLWRAPPARVRWYRSVWLAAAVAFGFSSGSVLVIGLAWHSYYIPSSSSYPTLTTCDYAFADQRARRPPVAYGDMVVFATSTFPNTIYVKRVVGLPGDRIQLLNGRLAINGAMAPREPDGDETVTNSGNLATLHRYIETLPNGTRHKLVQVSDDGPLDTTPVFVVPPGELFVLGDNRDNSADSRMPTQFGPVLLGNVMGRMTIIVWSCDRSRILSPIE